MPTIDGWRVVDSKGALVPVRVWVGYCDCGCKQSPTWVQVDGGTSYGVNLSVEAPQRDIRRNIGEAYPCAEIRAPGEMTTAEQVAALTAERDRLRTVADAARAYVEGGEFSCDDVRTESREALVDAIEAAAKGERP